MIRTGRMYFMKDGTMQSATHIYGLYQGEVRKMRIYVDDGKEGPSGIEDLEYMQDWADLDSATKTAFKNAMTEGQVYTLTDKRDSHPYKIAKLKDGNIWMVENLRLADYTCTSSDSDVASNFVLPKSSTSGFSDDTAANVYVDSTYGGYYNWFAATAGTGKSSSSDGDVAQGSISPKGWRLPTKDEYDALVTAYGGDSSTGSSNLRQTPVPGFVYAGYYYNSSPSYQGSYGYYWSSTAFSSTLAYSLYFYSSSAFMSSVSRRHGRPVRCILR